MERVKTSIIVFISILFGVGVVLVGLWFVPKWSDTFTYTSSQNNKEISYNSCVFPTSVDMAHRENYSLTRDASLKCAAFQEAKLHYTAEPNNTVTWDNAFPSREDWARRLREIKLALMREGQWETYYNAQDNYYFDYPADWEVFTSATGNKVMISLPGDQIVRPITISTRYDIGTSNKLQNERIQGKVAHMVVTRDGLVGNGKKLQTSARIPDKYGKLVTLNNDYSSFIYHNFYRHGEFFLDNDLVIVAQPLSVIVPDVGGWTEIHQEIHAKINNNEINELVSKEIELFDKIVGTFRKGSVKDDVVDQTDYILDK